MGTGSSATWLLSGTSGGVFKSGIQSLDSSGTMRFYVGSNYMQYDGSNLYLGGNVVYNSENFTPSNYLQLSGGTMIGSIILKGSTSADMTDTNIHPRLRFDNSDSSQTVSFIFTDYDTYRTPAGIKLIGNQGNEWFEAPKLIKTGSSDSYVLLGGGDHKALSTFTPSLVTSTTSTGITNVATSNTNTYLNIVQGGASTGSSTQVTGTGSVTVSSDTSGKLIINGIDSYLPLDSGRPVVDLDTLRTSGIKGGGSTTTNIPAGSYSYSPYIVMQSSTDRFVQLWFDSYGGNNIYYRNGTNSVWGAWTRLWHSGNLANGTTAQYIRGDGSLATYTDTTYSALSAAEASTGTATTARTISAKVLADEINRRSDLRYLPLAGGRIVGKTQFSDGRLLNPAALTKTAGAIHLTPDNTTAD